MYNFIKNDMTILKMLFIEFIKKTEKFVKSVLGNQTFVSDEKNAKYVKKIKELESICNNNLCDKSLFNPMYTELIDDTITLFNDILN